MNKNIEYLPIATPLHKDENDKKVIEIVLSTNRDISIASPEEQNNSPEILASTFNNNDNLYKYFCIFFPILFIIIIVIIYYSGLL